MAARRKKTPKVKTTTRRRKRPENKKVYKSRKKTAASRPPKKRAASSRLPKSAKKPSPAAKKAAARARALATKKAAKKASKAASKKRAAAARKRLERRAQNLRGELIRFAPEQRSWRDEMRALFEEIKKEYREALRALGFGRHSIASRLGWTTRIREAVARAVQRIHRQELGVPLDASDPDQRDVLEQMMYANDDRFEDFIARMREEFGFARSDAVNLWFSPRVKT